MWIVEVLNRSQLQSTKNRISQWLIQKRVQDYSSLNIITQRRFYSTNSKIKYVTSSLIELSEDQQNDPDIISIKNEGKFDSNIE